MNVAEGFNSEIIKESNKQLSVAMSFSEDHPHVDGHFDGFKILPGASQIGLVKNHLESMEKRRISIKELKRSKFLDVIIPNSKISLHIEIKSEGLANWYFEQNMAVKSKGILIYE